MADARPPAHPGLAVVLTFSRAGLRTGKLLAKRATISSVLAKHKSAKDSARALLLRTRPGHRTARMLDDIAAHCSSLKFFRRFPPEHCRNVLDAAEARAYEPGEIVFKQGDKGERFYIVLHGACELTVADVDKYASLERAEPVLSKMLFLMYAGDSFGELSLIENDARRSGTVRAADGGLEVLSLGRDEYRALVYDHENEQVAERAAVIRQSRVYKTLRWNDDQLEELCRWMRPKVTHRRRLRASSSCCASAPHRPTAAGDFSSHSFCFCTCPLSDV